MAFEGLMKALEVLIQDPKHSIKALKVFMQALRILIQARRQPMKALGPPY